MRKKPILLAAFVLLLCTALPCRAQNVNNTVLGLDFALSDDWASAHVNSGIAFCHNGSQNEFVTVEAVDFDWAWSLDLTSAEDLKTICDQFFSPDRLSASMSAANDIPVNVTADSVVDGYETYNNVKYYRYELAYTAHTQDFGDTPFYLSSFITAKNGKLYFVTYKRDTVSNHFTDISALLDTLSYRNGEIKIEINKELIFPDSAPMLLENRTLVPIRAIAEKMGYAVDWDGANHIVTLTSADDSTVLTFGIGSPIALKNSDEIIPLNVPAVIMEDRTYLPVRAVTEAMSAIVNWNNVTKTVEITKIGN